MLAVELVVLPSAVALSDRSVELLRAFHAGGGRLLADREPATHDEHGAPRPEPALRTVFGLENAICLGGVPGEEEADRLPAALAALGVHRAIDWSLSDGTQPETCDNRSRQFRRGIPEVDRYHLPHPRPRFKLSPKSPEDPSLEEVPLSAGAHPSACQDLVADVGCDPTWQLAELERPRVELKLFTSLYVIANVAEHDRNEYEHGQPSDHERANAGSTHHVRGRGKASSNLTEASPDRGLLLSCPAGSCHRVNR